MTLLLGLLSLTACSQKEKKLEPILATVDSAAVLLDSVISAKFAVNAQLIITNETVTVYNVDTDSAMIFVHDRLMNRVEFKDGSAGFVFRVINEDRYVYLSLVFDYKRRLQSAGFSTPGSTVILFPKKEIANSNL